MIRMRTEAEGWEEIAKVYERALQRHPDRIAAYQGICRRISDVDRLPWEVADRMMARAALRKPNSDGSRFRWPRTVEGAKKRIAYCRRQVRRLRGKKA